MDFKLVSYEIADHDIDFQLYFLSIFLFYMSMIYDSPEISEKRRGRILSGGQ